MAEDYDAVAAGRLFPGIERPAAADGGSKDGKEVRRGKAGSHAGGGALAGKIELRASADGGDVHGVGSFLKIRQGRARIDSGNANEAIGLGVGKGSDEQGVHQS